MCSSCETACGCTRQDLTSYQIIIRAVGEVENIIAIAISISACQCRTVGRLDSYILKSEVAVAIHIDRYQSCIVSTKTFHIESASVDHGSTRCAGFSPVIGRIKTSFNGCIAGDIGYRIVDGVRSDSEFDQCIVTCSSIYGCL